LVPQELQKVHRALGKNRTWIVAEAVIGYENNTGALDRGTRLHPQLLKRFAVPQVHVRSGCRVRLVAHAFIPTLYERGESGSNAR
jgi:hypothetical protein